MSTQSVENASPDAPQSRHRHQSVVIAIVNYCTADLTLDCLRSLSGQMIEYPGTTVVVADNASPDSSGDVIARAIEENNWSDWAQVLFLPRNGGFAFGNNAVIKKFLDKDDSPQFIWLLNSDTVVRPKALHALLDFMEAHPNAGIAGSCLEDPDGTQQCSTFRFHSIASEFETSAKLGPVSRLLERFAVAPPITRVSGRYDWVSGASMLVRAQVFTQAGLLDERYFLYYEETDFCSRAKDHGWECWFVGESRVIHLVGKSSGVTEREITTKRRSVYWFQSRRTYFMKHHGRLYAVGADLALAMGTILWRFRTALSGRPSGLPQYFLYDLARHSALLGKSIKDARK